MEINDIRKRIEDIDRHIVELLAERLKLSEEVAKIKLRRGVNIVDDAREVELRLLWRRFAVIYNIPLDFIEQIFSVVLNYSKNIQLKTLTDNICTRDKSISNSITIVGYGRMAQALGTLLAKYYDVTITGRDLGKADALAKAIGCKANILKMALQEGRYIVLALSPEAFEDSFILRIAENVYEKIVMDILSAKGKLFKQLEELSRKYQFHYISTHPLFGPSTPAIGQKIVLTPSETGKDVIDEVTTLWRCAGLDVIIAELEEHEKAMAVVQVLTHLLLLIFEYSIEELSKKLNINYMKFSTPTFREIVTIMNRLNEIKDVVFEIQKNNAFSALVHKVFLDIVSKIVPQLGDRNDIHIKT